MAMGTKPSECLLLWQWIWTKPVWDSHRLEVFIFELKGVGIAKLAEDLPSGLVPPTLDEELVQEQKPLGKREWGWGEESQRERISHIPRTK